MKISKVELKAFRAYKELENGTFNFTKEDGSIADFIALYAPNGFGKTSFFDAVEWCITNNIYRFTRKHNENMNLARADQNHHKHKQLILRNKDSENINGFVKVSASNNVFERNVPPVPRTGGRDFNFDEKDTEKAKLYFRDVLLAQDWIDAFLKEEKPEGRYEKFITFFGDNELDKYYKKLTQLISQNDKDVKNIKKELGGVQKELNYDLDASVLDNINSLIIILRNKKEDIPLIDLGFNEVQEVKLSGKIDERLFALGKDIKEAENDLNQINLNQSKIDSYYSNRVRIKTIDESLRNLNFHNKNIQKRKEKSNIIAKSNETLEALEQESKEVTIYKNRFDKYLNIVSDLGNNDKEEQKLKEDILEQNNVIIKSDKLLVEQSTSIEKLHKEKSERELFLSKIPEFYSKISQLKIDSESLSKKQSEKTSTLNFLEKEYQSLIDRRAEIDILQQQVLAGDYSSIELIENKVVSNSITELEYAKKLKLEYEEFYKIIKNQLNSQKHISDELKSLIAGGTEIINKTKAKACPLCSTEFENTEKLLEKILANPTIEESGKELLIKKNQQLEKLNKNSTIIKQHEKIIIDFVQNLIKTNSELIVNCDKKITEEKKGINYLDTQFKTKSKELSELQILTNKLHSEELEENVIKEINNQNQKIQEQQKQNDISKAERSKKAEHLKEKTEKIEIIKSFKESIKGDTDYIGIENFRIKNDIKELSVSILDEHLTDISKKIEKTKQEIKDIKKDISTLSESLKTVEESKVDENIDKEQKLKEELIKRTQEFEAFLEKWELIRNDINPKDIAQELKKIAGDISQRKKEHELLKEEFNKLVVLKGNVLPYIIQEELKIKAKNLEKTYILKKDKVSKELKQEKERVSSYIHKQVESFFNEELINQIYEKIDPHPDYKDISFRCDFNGSLPKLNVLVQKKGEEISSSPSLYFSTAQLNVLSLSIFLAKALNVKDNDGNNVDCIFLDDPIQSMDSINILSTIDLLRSLSVNYNKQIILSTHEENFFKLLQKKIPDNIFQSKFIELKTFGTVKN